MISKDMESKINSFATSCYRILLRIKRLDRVSNDHVYKMTDKASLIEQVRTRQLKFLGHILCKSEDEPANLYALYFPTHMADAGLDDKVHPIFSTSNASLEIMMDS